MFEPSILTNNADMDKYSFFPHLIMIMVLDFSLSSTDGIGKNVTNFRVNNELSVHSNNRKKAILKSDSNLPKKLVLFARLEAF